MSRSLVAGGSSFLTPPFLSQMIRKTNAISARGIASMPPSDPGTLGGVIVAVAEKLGIGE